MTWYALDAGVEEACTIERCRRATGLSAGALAVFVFLVLGGFCGVQPAAAEGTWAKPNSNGFCVVDRSSTRTQMCVFDERFAPEERMSGGVPFTGKHTWFFCPFCVGIGEHVPDKRVDCETPYVAGLRHGDEICRYEKKPGQVWRKITYEYGKARTMVYFGIHSGIGYRYIELKDGIPHGAYITFLGKLSDCYPPECDLPRAYAKLVDGILHGVEMVYEGYMRRMRPLKVISYVNGKLDGLFVEYNTEGVMLQEYPYDDGELHGVGVVYFADEKRHRVVCFERGNRAPCTQELDPDKPFQDGVPHGTWLSTIHEPPRTYRTRWSEGRMVLRDIVNPEGKRHGFLWRYDPDGNFERRTLYRDGEKVGSEKLEIYEGDLVGDAL